MKVIAIVNPVAGACKQGSALRQALSRLQSAGVPVELRPTTGPAHGTLLARQAAEEADYVVAAGGDGTVREIIQGLIGTSARLMIWPTGTENIIAKSLGFRAYPGLLLDCLTAGRTSALDVGMADNHCFSVVAGMGFDAEVVERLVNGRCGHITHLSYIDPIWRTFWTHKFPWFRVIPDGCNWWEGYGLLFVGNIWRYSLGLPVVRDAVPDDGLLDLLVLPCRSKIQLLAHAARTALGRHVEGGGARYLRFTRVRIESTDTVPVELDGDSGGRLPMTFNVRPRALNVRLPPM